MTDVGPLLKQARSNARLTQGQLAERSGVSKAMLSQIESGKKNPTIRVLYQVARGLECTVSELLELPRPQRIDVVRAGDAQTLVDAENGLERRLLAPSMVARGLQVLRLACGPGCGTGPFPPEAPDVVKHATVIRGRVLVRVGDQQVELGAGDSVTFPADEPHEAVNVGDEPVEVLHIIDYGARGRPAPVSRGTHRPESALSEPPG